MSFSSIIKNELCRIEPEEDCCLVSELAAVVKLSGTVAQGGGNEAAVRIITENPAFARRVFSLIKRIYNIHPEVITRRNTKLKKHISYIILITASMGAARILGDTGIWHAAGSKADDRQARAPYGGSCCKRAFLRGAFLAGGSMSDPRKTYHLEITSHTKGLAAEINQLMAGFSLNGKIIRRKGAFVIYLKEGENIVDFLNIVGAHSSLLELENVRILKEMRNNVNRIVNCETANLEKTVTASLRQVDNIRYIKETAGFNGLPESLREIAELRLTYDDASLKELGDMLSPPLGKSGVNHRLRKLDEFAEQLRRVKGNNG